MTVETRLPLIAHRGSPWEAPENTLASFRRALDYDIAGIELDVHLSRDGHVIVMHDYTVNRTTNGRGNIYDLQLTELKALDAGSWFDDRFTGEPIPTLREVCQLVYKTDLIINIELKNNLIPYDGLERAVLSVIADFNVWEQVLISSFNHNSLFKIRHYHPTIPIGVLYSHRLFRPWAYARDLGANALHPHYRRLDEPTIRMAHKYGLSVNPFTVNDRRDAQLLATWHVDHLITDNLPQFSHRIDRPSKQH